MIKDFFTSTFEKPEIPPLSHESVNSIVNFCKPAFGSSEWVALHGAKKPYYFNLDKVYADSSLHYAAGFHSALIEVITNVAKAEKNELLLKGVPPVLAFVCPNSAPAGIVQARALLSERLEWPSMLVFPDKRLLRARVMPGDGSKNFPESVTWLAGRYCLMLADAATTGESIAAAAGALRVFGSKTLGAVVVYNRDEGAEESLKTINIPLYSLLNPTDAMISDSKLNEQIKIGKKEVRDLSFVMAKTG